MMFRYKCRQSRRVQTEPKTLCLNPSSFLMAMRTDLSSVKSIPSIRKIVHLRFKFCLILIRKSLISVNNIQQTFSCRQQALKCSICFLLCRFLLLDRYTRSLGYDLICRQIHTSAREWCKCRTSDLRFHRCCKFFRHRVFTMHDKHMGERRPETFQPI